MRISRRAFIENVCGAATVAALSPLEALVGKPAQAALKRLYEYDAPIEKDSPITGRGIMKGTRDFNDFYALDHRGNQHLGLDFSGINGANGMMGEPIVAPSDGSVQIINPNKPEGGAWLMLAHSEIQRSYHGHITSVRSDLQVGTRVKRGEIIAFMGNTGEGPIGYGAQRIHIHFGHYLRDPSTNKAVQSDPMVYGLLHPTFHPSLPVYDFKARIGKDFRERRLILDSLNDKVELEGFLGNEIDGPERDELMRTRGRIDEMRKVLFNYTVKTQKHIPGSNFYTVMLEAFGTVPRTDVALTHPLMDPANPYFAAKYAEGAALFEKSKRL